MQKNFKRSIKSLAGIFAFIAGFFDVLNVSKAVAFSVKFAIEELFTNLVKYNPSSPSEISIALSIEAKNMIVRIVDSESKPKTSSSSATSKQISRSPFFFPLPKGEMK